MKTIFFNSILRILFIGIMSIVMMSCNHSDEQECFKCDTAPTVAKSDLQYMGWTVPFQIEEMPQDPPIYTLGLMPYARVFSLDENVLNQAVYDEAPDGHKLYDQYGSKFLKLLKESKRNDVPVRVYLLPETNEIWWVEEATEEDIRNYEAAKQPE